MSVKELARGDLQRAIGPEAGEYLSQIDGAIEGSPERFAVVKVGGEMAQGDNLEQLSGSVAHLGRLGYVPVLVHGGGPQINEKLKEHGVQERERIDGDRVTSIEAMSVVEEALRGVNSDIRAGLKSQGVEGAVSVDDAFAAELKDQKLLGMVGKPVDVDVDRIMRIVGHGKVPVIACLGSLTMRGLPAGKANINGDDAAAKLVEELNPEKFITLTGPGGVRDGSGRIIPNLTKTQAEKLVETGVIEGGMEKKVGAILQLIGEDVRDDGVLTHPNFIIPELFTHEGAGTLITKDILIDDHRNFNGLDPKRLRELIEDAFGGHLSSDYFERTDDLSGVYITPQGYDGVGIVRQPEKIPALYMDKLAVTPGEQGRGIADQILERIDADTTDRGFFWRAAPEAVFMQRYEDFADETHHHVIGPDGREWTVFFRNIGANSISDAIEWARKQPVTIDRHPEDARF